MDCTTSKPVVNMINWELYTSDGKYYLSGVADDHPRRGKGVLLSNISNLVDFGLRDDILTYETEDIIYLCPLKYMKIKRLYESVPCKYKSFLAELHKKSNSILDVIISASAQIALGTLETNFAHRIKELAGKGQIELKTSMEKELVRLVGEVRGLKDTVYLEIQSSGVGHLAYNIGVKIGVIKPSLHSGKFRDEVSYTKIDVVDFRYFVKGNIIETYSWSSNIKNAVVKNMCGYTVYFNGVELDPKETKTFSCTEYRNSVAIC